MRNAFNDNMREVGAPLADFWENDLELRLEDILRRLDTNGHLAEWAGSLNGARAAFLGRSLGLDTEDSIHDQARGVSCQGNYRLSCLRMRFFTNVGISSSPTAAIFFRLS